MTEMNMRKQELVQKPIMSQVIIEYLITIDTPLLPLATLMVYSLRLSQRVKSITTVTVSHISYKMIKGKKFLGSVDIRYMKIM